MVKKTISRVEFARLAGVTPSAVTKACNAQLKPALVGKRIDVAHAAAIEYLEKQAEAQTLPSAPGLDPLYERAIEVCRETGRYSIRGLNDHLNVGDARAKRILAQMAAAGMIPERGQPAPPPPKPTRPAPQPQARGVRVVQERRIAEDVGELDDVELPDNIAAYADMTLREIVRKFGTASRFELWLKALKDISALTEREIKIDQMRGQLVHRDLVQLHVIEPIDAMFIKLLSDGKKTIAKRVTAMHDAGRDMVEIEALVADQISSFLKPVKAKVARALKNV